MSPKTDFPFRLGTTSFIYPAGYVDNVRRLAPRVDEIELLLLESNDLPTSHVIEALRVLAQVHRITFNIHLPMDVFMGDPSSIRRNNSIETLARVIEMTAPLTPTSFTLHLTCGRCPSDNAAIEAWQGRAMDSTGQLLRATGMATHCLAVETLDFDPCWLTPIVEELDLSVCLDVGHVIRYGFHLGDVIRRFGPRISILHLHGVVNGGDHHAIGHLSVPHQRLLADFLVRFDGSASIEVFSEERLEQSLLAFPGLMAHATQSSKEA